MIGFDCVTVDSYFDQTFAFALVVVVVAAAVDAAVEIASECVAVVVAAADVVAIECADDGTVTVAAVVVVAAAAADFAAFVVGWRFAAVTVVEAFVVVDDGVAVSFVESGRVGNRSLNSWT